MMEMAIAIGLAVFCMSFGALTQNSVVLSIGLAFMITWVFLYLIHKEK